MMSVGGALNGFDSDQLVADMPPKAPSRGQLAARHRGRSQEEVPGHTAVLAGRAEGSAGHLPAPPQRAAH